MSLLMQLSLSGALMILVIAGLRAFLCRNVRRKVWLTLWNLVLLRLLVPVTIPAPTSFYNLFRTASAPAASASAQTAVQAAPPVNWQAILWLCGVGIVALTVIFTHLRSRRRFGCAVPVQDPLPQLVADVPVRTLDGLPSPLTYGIFRPVILLPANFPMGDEARLEHVLRHELAHIRNRDVLRKTVLLIAAAVHWFNPAVWLMLWLANQDMEMRCDAEAVAQLDNDRLGYARSLVAAETDRLFGFLPAGFSRSDTEAAAARWQEIAQSPS